MEMRSGLRKRSKTSRYCVGSMSVTSRQCSTIEAAAEPRTHMGMRRERAKWAMSRTISMYSTKLVCSITDSS